MLLYSRFTLFFVIMTAFIGCQHISYVDPRTKETKTLHDALPKFLQPKKVRKPVDLPSVTLLGSDLSDFVRDKWTKDDFSIYHQNSQLALEKTANGSESTWQSANNRYSGVVVPLKNYKLDNGTHCREYKQNVTIDGRTKKRYNAACRGSDGTWTIVE